MAKKIYRVIIYNLDTHFAWEWDHISASCSSKAIKIAARNYDQTVGEPIYRLQIDVREESASDVMNDLDELYKEPEHSESHLTPNEKRHGKIVEHRQDAYHDITVYADGYEESYYIGE